jgi:hypothetical protein
MILNLVIALLYILIFFNSCGYILTNLLRYLREKSITFKKHADDI